MKEFDLVLTQADLVLLRAALQFWSEEMPPGDVDVVAVYAGTRISAGSLQPGRAERLTEALKRCQPAYYFCDKGQPPAVSGPVQPTPAAAQRRRRKGRRIGTLLIKS